MAFFTFRPLISFHLKVLFAAGAHDVFRRQFFFPDAYKADL